MISNRPALLLVIGCLLGAGCGDPVLSAERAALPGEAPGIRTGPMHRAGQPCLVCHSDQGGAHPSFSVAGTVMEKPDNDIPVEGVLVHLTDAEGSALDLKSNCVGNFYVEAQKWQPTFPLRVDLSYPTGNLEIVMKSKIGRDGACAACHVDPGGAASPGHVYLTDDPAIADFARPALDCGGRGGRGL